ncbi:MULTISPECIES: hypothetical protein [unclassified Streptomyces]|uniref:hypothetical protein n=1 Tax=unclassified Streptomyces TaxID=2593676 RepID=UPI002E18A67F|nr:MULTISPECIES: hypothetical protein [unclassified Streptomyces]
MARAAAFAAVCVLLTALGHTLMSGTSVPWWALGAGATATGSAAWLLAGRERGLITVVGVAVAAQAALHSLFALAQVLAQPEPSGGTLARQKADMGSMDMGSMTHSMSAMEHTMGGMSPLGMLLAHLLAAVLSGLWLAYGEQAVFRIARSFAAWLVAPLRLVLRLPAPPHRPRLHVRRAESDRAPCLLLLTHTITSRGPPVGAAVA